MAKSFKVGEVVLFQREAGVGIRWELGEYMGPDKAAPGWHYIRDDTGFRQRHYLPSRRIKLPDYSKPIASNYDPHGSGR
jgi:hypothetical protein